MSLLLLLPYLPWYLRRLTDGSDEPFGILALVAFVTFLPWKRILRRPDATDLALFATTALALAVLGPRIPILVEAGIAIGGVALSGLRHGMRPGAAGLALLSLPLLASLEFFAGYPLRAACGWIASHLLNLWHDGIALSGVALVQDGHYFVIDRPCSGLRYLWCGWFLAALLATRHHLRSRHLAVLALSTSVLLFSANVLRILILFEVERHAPLGNPAHEAIGLAVFFLTSIGIFTVASKVGAPDSSGPVGTTSRLSAPASRFVTASALLTLLLHPQLSPLLLPPQPDPRHHQTRADEPLPALPRLLGEPLLPAVAAPQFAHLLERSPLQHQFFQWGDSLVLLRVVPSPTRSLHPADDCFAGAGYTIEPMDLWRDPEERLWRRFRARRGTEFLEIRHTITDATGNAIPDVSQWFWNALARPTSGPWHSWTVVRKLGKSDTPYPESTR